MLNLSIRETRLIKFALIFLSVFFCIQTGFMPVLDKKKNLENILAGKIRSLETMIRLSRQVQTNSGYKNTHIRQRPENFSLFAFLDLQARKTRVKKHIVYMKPYTRKTAMDPSVYLSVVKIKLQNICLGSLIDFIQNMESTDRGIVIISLSVSRAGRQKNRLDALVETGTLMKRDKRE